LNGSSELLYFPIVECCHVDTVNFEAMDEHLYQGAVTHLDELINTHHLDLHIV
jgi:hypothetical protein